MSMKWFATAATVSALLLAQAAHAQNVLFAVSTKLTCFVGDTLVHKIVKVRTNESDPQVLIQKVLVVPPEVAALSALAFNEASGNFEIVSRCDGQKLLNFGTALGCGSTSDTGDRKSACSFNLSGDGQSLCQYSVKTVHGQLSVSGSCASAITFSDEIPCQIEMKISKPFQPTGLCTG
jgi:hypothetical protein